MKEYLTPILRCIELNAQDVLTSSNDLEYDVQDWLTGETKGDFGQ